jgi:hypothetical protein
LRVTQRIFFVKLIDRLLEGELKFKEEIDKEASGINDSLEKDIENMSLELMKQREEVKKVVNVRISEYINNIKGSISRMDLLESKAQSVLGENEKPKIVLWRALLEYVLNNNLGVFVLLLVYNSLRVALFVKTKKLEHREIVIGIESDFTFAENRKWYRFYQAMEVGFWFNILLVIYNSYYFLNQSVYVLK